MPQERARSTQYINRLRILSIYAVITAHVTIWETTSRPPQTFHWWLGCGLFYACFFSIPVFVMISGALLLDDARREPPLEFYGKRLYRVGIPLVVWTVVYLWVRAFIDHETLTFGRVTQLILTAEPYYHLWFLYMMLGLYLVTPPLRTFVRHATPKERWFVIVGILVLANAHLQTNALLWNNPRSVFTLFVPYIAYYLCGYELSRTEPGRIRRRYVVLGVGISALYLAVFSGAFLAHPVLYGQPFFFDFFTPPIIFLSLGIFWAARRHEATSRPPTGIRKTALEWVASATLGIYVLHPLVLAYAGRQLGRYAQRETFVAGIIIMPLLTFAICYGITSLLMNIPILRRTVS